MKDKKKNPVNPKMLLWWVAIISLVISAMLYFLLKEQAQYDVALNQRRMLFPLVGIIIAGICNASFAGPMKKMPKWAWENQWGMWAVWALLVTSWSFALLRLPNRAKKTERRTLAIIGSGSSTEGSVGSGG